MISYFIDLIIETIIFKIVFINENRAFIILKKLSIIYSFPKNDNNCCSDIILV